MKIKKILNLTPQKDLSFRFMQVPTPFMEFKEIENFIEKEKNSKIWKAFIEMYTDKE